MSVNKGPSARMRLATNGANVRLEEVSVDDDGEIVGRWWNDSRGAKSTAKLWVFKEKPGTQVTVELRVRDNHGAESTTSGTYIVNQGWVTEPPEDEEPEAPGEPEVPEPEEPEVPEPPDEPEPPIEEPEGPKPTPWLEEDFSSYASTEELRADTRGIYVVASDGGRAKIHLDKSVGYDGSPASMRYDFSITAQCKDQSIGRVLRLPAAVTELWYEVAFRFPPGFRTNWGHGGCNPDLKLIFLGRTPDGGSTGRRQIKWGNGGSGRWQNSFDVDNFQNIPGSLEYADGKWWRLRNHLKIHKTEGVWQIWLEDRENPGQFKLVVDIQGVDTTRVNPTVSEIWLGRNINQGPDVPMSYWWGRVRAWNTDPGWAK